MKEQTYPYQAREAKARMSGERRRRQRQTDHLSVSPQGAAIEVLLIEDSFLVRERLAAMIKSMPRVSLVGCAENGELGLELFRALRPDVVLLDVHLPKRDGFELIPIIKRECPGCVLAVFTTLADSATRQRCRDLGADYFFDKAAEFEQMLELLERLAAPASAFPAEADFRAFLQAVPDGFYVAGPDGRLLDVNEAYCRMLGYRREQLLDMRLSDLDAGESTASLSAHILRLREKGWHHFETCQRAADGHAVDVEIIAHCVPARGGRIFAFVRDVTARKQADTELLRLHTAVEQAAEAVVITEPTGIIRYVNPAFERITGYARAEAVGQNSRILKSGVHPLEFYQQLWDTITSGQVWRGWFRNRRKDGTLYDEEAAISPVRDPQGRIINFIAVKQDVTERKRAEAALRESARRLATLIANLQGMVYRCRNDRNWTMEFVSEAAKTLTGYSPDELVGNAHVAYNDLILEADRDLVWNEVQSALSEKQPFQITYRIRTASGQVKWVWEQGRGVWDEQGQLLALEGYIADITEHKQLEEKLRQSEEHFRSLIENSSDLVAELNPDGTVFYLSPSVKRVLGYEPEAMVGQSVWDFVHAEDLQRAQQAMQSVISTAGNTVSMVVRIRHRNNSWHTFETAAKLEGNNNGERRVIINARDITERLQLEEQLRQMQKLESIGQLAAGVAHDFNNVLAVIQGHAQLMQLELGDNSVASKSLIQILQATERATNLTRQLLMFSRKQQVQPRTADLNKVIEHLTKMLRRLIGEHIELHFSYSSAPAWVHADVGMLEQVLVNLAVNARDAMPKGGKLHIETRQVEVDTQFRSRQPEAALGPHVCMRVADTGCGIAPEVLPHIFEPFFTTKEPGKGTGLGLATVHGIVKQHGGWIEVDSQPGHGTEFRVYLPLSNAPQEPETAQPSIPVEGTSGNKTILLVEDEDSLREIARTVLVRAGYSVLEASSGPQALELATAHGGEIDVLVTDIVMPGGMTGSDLAESLQAQRNLRGVVFTSGYPNVQDPEFPRHRGSVFITKPYTAQMLCQAISDCLKALQR